MAVQCENDLPLLERKRAGWTYILILLIVFNSASHPENLAGPLPGLPSHDRNNTHIQVGERRELEEHPEASVPPGIALPEDSSEAKPIAVGSASPVWTILSPHHLRQPHHAQRWSSGLPSACPERGHRVSSTCRGGEGGQINLPYGTGRPASLC